MSQIIYRYPNGLLGWPDNWEPRYNGGCNEPCDMLIGPCACGAWHTPECWTAELNRYNVEIRDYPIDRTFEVADLGDLVSQKSQATLSYF